MKKKMFSFLKHSLAKQSELGEVNGLTEVVNAKTISIDTTDVAESTDRSQIPKFQKIASSGLDLNLLQQRQEILFYDEIVLYEVLYFMHFLISYFYNLRYFCIGRMICKIVVKCLWN